MPRIAVSGLSAAHELKTTGVHGVGAKYVAAISAAGNEAVNKDTTDKTRRIFLDPYYAVIKSGTTAVKAQTDGTNFSYYTIKFVDASNYANTHWVFSLPPYFDAAANIVVTLWWYAPTATSGNCFWQFTLLGRMDNEAWDAALGAVGSVIDAAKASAGLLNAAALSVTPANHGLAAGDICILQLWRLGTHVNDTLADVAHVVMVTIDYEVIL